MLSNESYKYEASKVTVNSILNSFKVISLISSLFAIASVFIFFILDLLLFVNKFGFSYATFKSFYMTSFDYSTLNILIFFALLPILAACFIILLSYVIAKIALYIIKNKRCETNNIFYILFSLMYIFISILLVEIYDYIYESIQILEFLILYIISILLSILFTFYSVYIFRRKKSIVVKILFLFLLYLGLMFLSNIDFSEILILIGLFLILFFFIPFIIIIFFEIIKNNKNINRENSKHRKWLLASVSLFIPFVLLYLNWINFEQWTKVHDEIGNDVSKSSLNLFLNKIFLIDNNKLININVTDYFIQIPKCLKSNNIITMNEKAKVLSISENNKLYFLNCNSTQETYIFAIKTIYSRGKVYNYLVDISKLN